MSFSLVFIINCIKDVKNIDISIRNNSQNYTQIFDKNGNELEYTKSLKNNYIKLNEIPKDTVQAFISIEDKNFYKHNGLNYKRIIKATMNNIKSKSMSEGASTITQQLVKNKFLSNEKTISRKIKEAYLTKKLEKKETKDKILETYLNTIYFGNGAYGIGNASKIFFDKSPKDLSLSEGSLIAGIIKSPKNYSPINNLENSINRRNLVLSEMLKDNQISETQYNIAINENIDQSKMTGGNQTKQDLYSQFVLKEASEILNTDIGNIILGGYKIYTNQDSQIQSSLDKEIFNENNYHKNSYGNIADSLSMIIDNQTNSVIAIQGKSKYDLVDFKRQPGSLIKPILTYAPAIEEGKICAKTQILDEPINIGGYTPHNVGNTYSGYVSVEDCVAKSLNIPTIKITEEMGLKNCINYAKKCGINFDKNEDYNYSVCLGGLTYGTTLKEITDAYSVFTHNGNYSKSTFINQIISANKKSLYGRKMTENKVIEPQTAYLMSDIMKYSVENGTSKKLSKFNFDIAGKTGTVSIKNSNNNTDAYSLAYTSSHTMSVWLGNYSMDEKFVLEGKNNGGTYCTQIISNVFDDIYSDYTPKDFSKPDNIEEVIIDGKTLSEDHIVVLGENIPERYQERCLMSTKFKPTAYSNKFDVIEPFDFQVTTFKNSCQISFDAKDYLIYKIYRESVLGKELLTTIKNREGEINFVDKNIEFNTAYNYYIETTNNISQNKFVTQKQRIEIKKEYLEILNNQTKNQDSLSWLFQ